MVRKKRGHSQRTRFGASPKIARADSTPPETEGINRLIRAHESTVPEWERRHLIKNLYVWFDRFNRRFFDRRLSSPVISAERTRISQAASFVSGRDGLGIRNRININSDYLDRPLWFVLALLAHETIHFWLSTFAKSSPNGYHSRSFRSKAAEIGIACDPWGRMVHPLADPFVSFLGEFGVEAPRIAPAAALLRPPGRSKLRKLTCKCPINVWVADPRFSAVCQHCHHTFKAVSEGGLGLSASKAIGSRERG